MASASQDGAHVYKLCALDSKNNTQCIEAPPSPDALNCFDSPNFLAQQADLERNAAILSQVRNELIKHHCFVCHFLVALF